MRVIKDSLPAILPTVTSITNKSLVSGVFSQEWAVVTPVLSDSTVTGTVVETHAQSAAEKNKKKTQP